MGYLTPVNSSVVQTTLFNKHLSDFFITLSTKFPRMQGL